MYIYQLNSDTTFVRRTAKAKQLIVVSDSDKKVSVLSVVLSVPHVSRQEIQDSLIIIN